MWWNDNLDAAQSGTSAAPIATDAERRRVAQEQISERRMASRKPSEAKRAMFGYREALPLGIAAAIAKLLGVKDRDLSEGLSGFLQGHEMGNNWRYEQALADEERARKQAENEAISLEEAYARNEQFSEATKKDTAERRSREFIKALIGIQGVGQLNLDDPRVQEYLHSLSEGEFQKFLSDYHRASLPQVSPGSWIKPLPTEEQLGLRTRPSQYPKEETSPGFGWPHWNDPFRNPGPTTFGEKLLNIRF